MPAIAVITTKPGDERAEGDDEDHERHRQRGDLGPLESVSTRCMMALLELASPNSPTNSPGWPACTAAAAASAGCTRSFAGDDRCTTRGQPRRTMRAAGKLRTVPDPVAGVPAHSSNVSA
jgi:hypothetical protein